MNYESLSSELVRALRGRRSQQAFSRRLGYSANVLYTWEKGRRFPAAGMFFSAAQRVNIALVGKLEGFLGAALHNDPTSPAGVAELLTCSSAKRSSAELARAVGAHRTTIARWLDARAQPRLPELLRWIEATTQRLLEFVSIFADPSELASTAAAVRALAAQRVLAYDVPWSHAILRAIETHAYQSAARPLPGVLAAMVGMKPELEPALLSQLAAAGQIARRRGRWAVKDVLTVDTGVDSEKNWQLKRHWAQVALDRMGASPVAGAFFSYNLFAISGEDLERIRQLHVEYFERVRNIIAGCKSSERIVLINQQLVPLAAEAS